MNWTRIGLAGVAAGIVTWFSDFVLHGIVMAPTYKRLSQVYSQTQSNPALFLLVAVTLGLMATLLFEVKPSDAPTYALSAAVLGAVALLACYIPARRAASADALAALKAE